MKNILSIIKRTPKLTSLIIATILTAITLSTAMFAWGPDRPTFTVEKPADYITFNSITNNPNYGDERNFVTIKDAKDKTSGGWVDSISVKNGKEYYVRMYVHNNAAENLYLVANDVTAKFNIPDQTAKRIQIDGYLSSSNAKPSKIWDQAVFTSSDFFSLDYVKGSATYTNNVFTSGKELSNSVVGSGAELGYASLNGKVPGCFQYSGYVIFKVKATTVDFDIEKTVRINGSSDKTFKESVDVKPGDKVDYQIYFKNNGGTQLKDVVIKDNLPKGVTYVSGSTYLHNSDGTKQVADGITTKGLNIGGYEENGDAYIKFTAKVVDNDSLTTCGKNTLTNIAEVTTGFGSKDDDAKVTTTKTCKVTPATPVKPTKPVTPQEPVTPAELPKTGAAEDVMAVIGVGAIVTSAGYYIASRRQLFNL